MTKKHGSHTHVEAEDKSILQMNRQYFELIEAREKCLQSGDVRAAEALWKAAMEIAKLGVLGLENSGVRINSKTYDIRS